ncbi:MAG TPA: glycosyltransferase family 9 protein [Ignavibacteriaceae bacterium]|nr:glycosyltransferase family 9 protein [Ignavibacteriaceae bacterium]
MILKNDCRHFPGDKPCWFNKHEGAICDSCGHYSPVAFKILIIKLDALGDVLRTTSILHALKEKYPDSFITWLTKNNAKDIFKNNPLVDEVLTIESPELTAILLSTKYNLMIHPDASPTSASLASIVNADEKKGYILNSLGKIEPLDDNAVEWLEMGAFDQLKKKNTKTYQQIIHEIAGLDYKQGKIIVNITEDEQNFAKDFCIKNNLTKYDYLLGINSGSSKRWKLKQWRLEGFIELIKELKKTDNVGILLYGGKEEQEQNEQLKKVFPDMIDTGSDNSLREFFALMSLPDIVITGDTLALHAAAALGKKTICLFGPTSYNEIEDYGLIEKVYPDMECLVCYLNECAKSPNCMDLISSKMVLDKVNKLKITILH